MELFLECVAKFTTPQNLICIQWLLFCPLCCSSLGFGWKRPTEASLGRYQGTQMSEGISKMVNSIIHLQDKNVMHNYQEFYNRTPVGMNSFLTKPYQHSSFSWNNLMISLKSKLNLESFKAHFKTNRNIIHRISFNGMQGTNKDIVNDLCLTIICRRRHEHRWIFTKMKSMLIFTKARWTRGENLL